MCLSKSSAGCRAVSKVTSTNCWHSRLESTTKAPRNLCCLARQNTPTIFPAEKKDPTLAICYLRQFEKLTGPMDFFPLGAAVPVLQDYKPNSYWICSEASGSPLRMSPDFPQLCWGWWDCWNTGKETGASAGGFSNVKSEDTPWTLLLQFLKPLSTAFYTWIKREIHSSKRSSMNKSYKTQIMPAD